MRFVQYPFFQFSQLKKYQPESIPQIKADYKENWQVWQQLIQQVAAELGAPFAPPHIERWCNGWQVRAHFLPISNTNNIKFRRILSILLNRRRLSVSLDWHCYKADVSPIALPDYNRWLDNFDTENTLPSICGMVRKANMTIIVPSPNKATAIESFETTKISSVSENTSNVDDLGKQGVVKWIAETVEDLLPLYEACHGK